MPRDTEFTPLSPAAAATAILQEVSPLPQERVPLGNALGRVLAAPVSSPIDLPPWDNAAMDGYAVRSSDVPHPRDDERVAGPVLRIVQEVAAGGVPARSLGPGECARIFTGAPIPPEADSVIRQEDTTRVDAQRVRIDRLRDVGRNVRRRGEDVRQGAVVLPAGQDIGPAQIGMLASIAEAHVAVHRRPVVGVLASGDELVPVENHEAILSGRRIASSNTYSLLAAARAAGADPVDLGIVGDDPAALRRRLASAASVDLLLTSGGMSVGEKDHLREILGDLGAGLRFWRVRMRPGAPVGFGIWSGRPWVGLPGNPVSAMVAFELFARPAIRRLLGHARPFRRTVRVRLAEPVETHAPLRHFLRVQLTEGSDLPIATLTGPQGSGMLSSMARADALLIVPEERARIAAGEILSAIRLDESVHVETAPY